MHKDIQDQDLLQTARTQNNMTFYNSSAVCHQISPQHWVWLFYPAFLLPSANNLEDEI